MWKRMAPVSKLTLCNYRAFRKLAVRSGLNGLLCRSNGIACSLNGNHHAMKYHVLASNCVPRYNDKSTDNLDKSRSGYLGFGHCCFERLDHKSNLLSRNLLTNSINCHSHSNINEGILKNRTLNPWKHSLSLKRQLSINTKSILEASPGRWQPYMRLIRFDKPIGSWLLFWPCTWSIGLAAEAGHLPDLYILTLFGLGSFLMRGSGCIINDMWDKEIDRRVERTKSRPLASGELSQFQALCFLGGTLSLSLGILLQLNLYSVVLGASSMILVILYPLAKRYTYWPQFVLGLTLNLGVLLAWSGLHGSLEWPVIPLYMACVLYTMFYDTIYSHQCLLTCVEVDQIDPYLCQWLTFNYGAMLGWTAVQGAVDWPILPLYTSCLLWTLIYDTIYAHQDKYDDMLVGVKSTALKLGDKTKPWLMGFSSLMLSGLTATGYLCEQTWPYYLAVTATGAHLWYQLSTVNLEDPEDCFAKFKSNSRLGLVMFLGIIAGTLLKESKDKDKTQEEQV